MTVRSYTYFTCQKCGHHGHERLSENELATSPDWRHIACVGLGPQRPRADGKEGPCHACPKCGGDMLHMS